MQQADLITPSKRWSAHLMSLRQGELRDRALDAMRSLQKGTLLRLSPEVFKACCLSAVQMLHLHLLQIAA